VPVLNFRLARVDRLIDINGVSELDYVRADGAVLRIGALLRQADLERSATTLELAPLLVDAVRLVGHPQTRNRGTVGGAVAHADPASELAVALTALDATFHVRSRRGRRALKAGELFVSSLMTSLEPDELLVEIEVPVGEPTTRSAIAEFAPRHNDFALGGAAVVVRAAPDGTVERAAIGLLAAAPTPARAAEAESWLAGRRLEETTAAEAAEIATADIDPPGDVQGSAAYRRAVVRTMVERALLAAGGTR
jgi:CO/xanthine dehydrogenase FAD-binding subunit